MASIERSSSLSFLEGLLLEILKLEAVAESSTGNGNEDPFGMIVDGLGVFGLLMRSMLD